MSSDGDHWQGEEGKWLQTIKPGPDSLHIGAPTLGESALTGTIEVSMPLLDPTACKPFVGNPRSAGTGRQRSSADRWARAIKLGLVLCTAQALVASVGTPIEHCNSFA
jgi:hypothetical protein